MADFSKNLQKAVIIAKKELDFYGKILKKKKMDNKLFKIQRLKILLLWLFLEFKISFLIN